MFSFCRGKRHDIHQQDKKVIRLSINQASQTEEIKPPFVYPCPSRCILLRAQQQQHLGNKNTHTPDDSPVCHAFSPQTQFDKSVQIQDIYTMPNKKTPIENETEKTQSTAHSDEDHIHRCCTSSATASSHSSDHCCQDHHLCSCHQTSYKSPIIETDTNLAYHKHDPTVHRCCTARPYAQASSRPCEYNGACNNRTRRAISGSLNDNLKPGWNCNIALCSQRNCNNNKNISIRSTFKKSVKRSQESHMENNKNVKHFSVKGEPITLSARSLICRSWQTPCIEIKSIERRLMKSTVSYLYV